MEETKVMKENMENKCDSQIRMNEVLSERSNLFEPNDLISIRLKLQGNVAPEQVKEAVQKTYECNEVTLSKLVIDADGRVLYKRSEESGCKVAICGTEWRQIIQENERIPFRLSQGEFIRSFVIPKENGCELLIIAHHLSGDGKAMICFTEEFLRNLSGEKVLFQPQILLSRETIENHYKLKWVIRKYVVSCNRKWAKEAGRIAPNGSFSFEDYDKLYASYWSKNKSTILTHTFSKEETAHIKEQAKSFGVTVNSYLVTAFAKSGTGIRTIGVPVTVREDGNVSMANYTGGIEIHHEYKVKESSQSLANQVKKKEKGSQEGSPKSERKSEYCDYDKEKIDFRRNAMQIHKKIAKKKQSRWMVLNFVSKINPVLFDAMLLSRHGIIKKEPFLEKFAWVLDYAEDKTRDLGITNLMVLPLKTEYEGFRLTDFTFIPPAVTYSKNVIGVSTLNDQMTITCHAMNNAKETLDLFEKGIQLLQNLPKLI